MSQSLRVGDVVRWTSQSAGHYSEKTGVIETLIPAGAGVARISKNPHPGGWRDHESYLVRVKGRGLYWPRVSLLAKVSAP